LSDRDFRSGRSLRVLRANCGRLRHLGRLATPDDGLPLRTRVNTPTAPHDVPAHALLGNGIASDAVPSGLFAPNSTARIRGSAAQSFEEVLLRHVVL
jgi:hypothetical protein